MKVLGTAPMHLEQSSKLLNNTGATNLQKIHIVTVSVKYVVSDRRFFRTLCVSRMSSLVPAHTFNLGNKAWYAEYGVNNDLFETSCRQEVG